MCVYEGCELSVSFSGIFICVRMCECALDEVYEV